VVAISGEKKEKGQGLVEYVLVISFIALLIISAVALVGDALHEYYLNNIVSYLNTL
jgi:Flp pilus assembly pilin Flp